MAEAVRQFLPVRSPSYISSYLDNFLMMHPHAGIRAGLRDYDGRVSLYTADSIAARVAYLERFLAETPAPVHPLISLPSQTGPIRLSRHGLQQWDLALARWDAKNELWRWRTLQPHRTNPLSYIPLLDCTPYVKRVGMTQPERLHALTLHCEAIPAVIETMTNSLIASLSRPAIDQTIHSLTILQRFISGDLATLLPVQRHVPLQRAIIAASDALHRGILFLQGRLPHAYDGSGYTAETLLQTIQMTEGISTSLETILAQGYADLELNRERLQQIATSLGMSVGQAMRHIGTTHPHRAAILEHTRTILEELRLFIVQQNLVTIPPIGKCRVLESASTLRHGSAFIDAPGPFEARHTDANFYITLPDLAWPSHEQEAWLSKHTIPGLANTAIHEAWPGHFLQFAHLAHAPSHLSKLLTCTSYIEGWAHYAESWMVDIGFHGDNPWYEFQQLSMALLRDCRLITSIQLHLGTMTLPEAVIFIEQEAYYPAVRARQEAQRCQRDPTCLLYALGKWQMTDLIADLRTAHPRWSERMVHDTVLQFGAPPLPLLRWMLLASGTNAGSDSV